MKIILDGLAGVGFLMVMAQGIVNQDINLACTALVGITVIVKQAKYN